MLFLRVDYSSMRKCIVLFGLLATGLSAQVLNHKETFTRQDSLRGSNNEFRNWWDVKKYLISVEPDFSQKSIKGSNTIIFDLQGKQQSEWMQIDLQEPMQLHNAQLNGVGVSEIKKEGNVYFIKVPAKLKKKGNALHLTYAGNPLVAKTPPWDGGWIFETDEKNRPWMTVACQGLGASVWYPNKDYLGDEPDKGVELEIITPNDLVGVGNGRLIEKKALPNQRTAYRWKVINPINNYNVVPSIGHYVSYEEVYQGEKGPLDLSYHILDYNLEKAKKQFIQTAKMLKSFEHWFGPYPFYEDSFKLIDSPHLGMEHQSGIAYGNRYENGYLGRDISGSGWGMNWDFILIHEAGHEWFGNNITNKDVADMWIHEGFTSYSEALHTEMLDGKKASSEYVLGVRRAIKNDSPIIGVYGVNKEGSGDMYNKGSNIVHTLRTWMNNDEQFRQMLRGMNHEFYHQTVTTEQVEAYLEKKSGLNLKAFFNQYLRTVKIPVLNYKVEQGKLHYRYINTVDGFTMPLRLMDEVTILKPTNQWQTVTWNSKDKQVVIDPNYYIDTQEVTSALPE